MSADGGYAVRESESHTSSFLFGVVIGLVSAWWIASFLHQKALQEIEAQVEHVEALADECEARVAEVTMGRRVR